MTQTKSIYHEGRKAYDERRGLSAPKSAKDGSKEDWKAFRELRNRVKVALREAEREYYVQEIHEKENNCGAIWKTI